MSALLAAVLGASGDPDILGLGVRAVAVAGAAGSSAGVYIWGRSARRLQRALKRQERALARTGESTDGADLARSAWRKELHTAVVYAICAVAFVAAAIGGARWAFVPMVGLAGPIAMTVGYGRRFLAEARITEERSLIVRRAEEVLAQDDLAPRRWAARLAPGDLPQLDGFEVGTLYEPGTGAMAGDFFDVYRTASTRLAVVIGDVAGHGIEPSITAFQTKYLLRVFLERYRDPAQAVEELNKVMSASGRPEDLISLCVCVFDLESGSVRTCSAGHPPAWFWHDGEVLPLRASGPLLTLDPAGTYFSREVELESGDLLLLYTDGLTEARNGDSLFGEDRVAGLIRRDPGREPQFLVKALLEAARDFASEPLNDDVAILAIRRL